MQTEKKIRWRWGVIAALAITLLSLFPQCFFWWERGQHWNGGQVFFYTDEPAYAAYVNCLIQGRPRRNDPYTGRDENEGDQLSESIFSIQFLPAYLVALAARVFGLTTASAFIFLTPIVAFLTSLAVFRFLAAVTEEDQTAAAFVPVVLCLGILLSGNGVICAFLGRQTTFVYLPFLRRYTPAVAFPCFLLFFLFVWRAFTDKFLRKRLLNALGAGLAFTVCVYSYFFFWTAAVSWLLLLVLLWLLARPAERRTISVPFLVIAALAAAATVPYAVLLTKRSPTMDTVQVLVRTRAPDLWRSIEVIALLIVLALVVVLKRGKLSWRDPRILITAAFALLPFILFNQQVVTGRSLQPMHYEQFVASYTTLIALALTMVWLWRIRDPNRHLHLPSLLLLVIGGLSFVWGMGETWIATRRFTQANVNRDDARPAALRLRTLATTDSPDQIKSKVVFAPDFARGDTLPMEAPQPMLWAPHMFVFPGVTSAENKERFFQFLYYSGVDAKSFASVYQNQGFAQYAIFGWERANPNLTADYRPITAAELAQVAQNYERYVSTFDVAKATQPMLGYLLIKDDQKIDLTNLDRWYQRDQGERVGRFVIYRLTLRQN
jgi:hypothetical protein